MVLVAFPDGDYGDVDADPWTTTVLQFKYFIEQCHGRSRITSKLTHEGEPLDDAKLLSDYGIDDDSVIVAQMQVYVHFAKWSGFCVDVNLGMSVGEVKVMVESTMSSKGEECPMDRQRLILNGNNLDDGMTLGQCGVGDMAKLFVVVRDGETAALPSGHVDIYVGCDGYGTVTLATPLSARVSDLKDRLEKMQAIMTNYDKGKTRLSFAGKDLEDGSTLLACGVGSECLLYLDDDDDSLTLADLVAKKNEAKKKEDGGESDVASVMSMAGASKKRAAEALKINDGDVNRAVSWLDLRDEDGLDAKDIQLVMSQGGCSRTRAVRALREEGSDLVEAIMSIEDGEGELRGEGWGEKDIKRVMSWKGCSREEALDCLEQRVWRAGCSRTEAVTALQKVVEVSAAASKEAVDPQDEDVELVMSQAGSSRARAIKALEDSGGDLIKAMMSLTAGSTSPTSRRTDGNITVFVMDDTDHSEGFQIDKDTTPMSGLFYRYSTKVNVPLDNLRFEYGDFGELPHNCNMTASELGINDQDTILANKTGAGASIIDLTSGGTSSDDRITLLLRDTSGNEVRFAVDKERTSLGRMFREYAERLAVSLNSLQFAYEDLGELPPSCEETPAQLGIHDGAVIMAGVLQSSRLVDLTEELGYSTGNSITVTVKEPEADGMEFKIDDRMDFVDILVAYSTHQNVDLSSLKFIYKGRQIDEGTQDTPNNIGMQNEDVIHAFRRTRSDGIAARGKDEINVLLFDIEKNDKESFRVDPKAPFRKVFDAYAQSRKVSLASLRFLHGDRPLYADVYSKETSRKLGVNDGDTVYVLAKMKKRETQAKDDHLTRYAIHNFYNMSPEESTRMFEPTVQVLELDRRHDGIVVALLSDGERALYFECHPRISEAVKSGIITKHAVIHVSDFRITSDTLGQKTFVLVDADEDLSNPGKILGHSSSIESLNETFSIVRARQILARNVIADFVLRSLEYKKARKAEAQRVIDNFLWRIVASRRRQRLRQSAILVQKMLRGHAARNVHLEKVQRRIEDFRQFTSVWKQAINEVPQTAEQSVSGWSLVREKIDLRRVEMLDDDGDLAETDQKLNEALTGALQVNGDEDGISVDESDHDEDEAGAGIDDEKKALDEEEIVTAIDWSQFQVSTHVVKFIRNGDTKYREIFIKKMKQLAKGERSHKLQKPLKGCESIIYETYLENKSGFRILWTQEGETIIVWFIAKHKCVSRLAKLIDDAKNRTARQQLPQAFVSEIDADSSLHAAANGEVMLDALGNVPLKLYDVNFDAIDDIANKSWMPQMHLTKEERSVVEEKGTVLLLGRSGTGKTICISNRIEYDRQRIGHKPNFSQLFISRSTRLCRYVEGAVGSNERSTFTTFDKLVHQLDSSLSQNSKSSFSQRQHVDFSRFRRDFYSEQDPQEKVSALIVWKSIRTWLKGSIEAFQTSTGILSREYFVSGKLGKNRCKIATKLRSTIYDAFLQYQNWMKEQKLWDDCDRIRSLLKKMEEAKIAGSHVLETIKRSKVYVDEVQDYLQIEILLFFYIGAGPGSLFLAGDPAQSVVEGTDFRFEEIRSVGFFVAGKGRRDLIPEKPKVVNVNFRSHSGVLNCAGGFLELLFDYFPNSVKQLEKDYGLFKGARPGVFHKVDVQQLLTLLKENLQGAVVLTHDERASDWKRILGHELVYGIREAKGLEFKTVIILDFFAELPQSLQKPWRNLLLRREGDDFEMRYPLVETQLKLLYTAVTRCIETLFFAETMSSVAGDAAVRWLTTSMNRKEGGVINGSLATINNVADLESMAMANDEFCIVGIDNAELAGSPDIETEQAMSYLNRAIYCFEKAQSSELVAKAQAHSLSIALRSKIASRSDASMETTEAEAAQVVWELLKENLLEECTNLLNSVLPMLPQYTQEKLEETITTKIYA